MKGIKKTAEKVQDEISPFDTLFVEAWFSNNFNGRLAYKSLKPYVTNESADSQASFILSCGRVKDYIEIKQERIRKSEEIKLSYIIDELHNIINESKGSGEGEDKVRPDQKSRLQAIAQLTKIAGFDAPKKIDITSKGESLVFNETKTYQV